MQLDLVRTSGRAAKAVEAEFVRELNEADLAMLSLPRNVTAPPIKKIKDSHHSLARCLAQGAKPAEASLMTGFSLSRISILQADPSFQELLAHYRAGHGQALADLQERMSTISFDAIEELRDRLHDDPGQIDVDQLIDLIKATADRTGHGPSSKQTQVKINVDLASRLEAARRRAGMVINQAGAFESSEPSDG